LDPKNKIHRRFLKSVNLPANNRLGLDDDIPKFLWSKRPRFKMPRFKCSPSLRRLPHNEPYLELA
jgi:hypothetical protein